MLESEEAPQFLTTQIENLPTDIPVTVPQDSNLWTVAGLFLVALIYFIQNGLPLFKRKKDPVEVNAVSEEEHELLQGIQSSIQALTTKVDALTAAVNDVVVSQRVEAEIRRQDRPRGR